MKQETKPRKFHLQLQIFQHGLLKAFRVLKQMQIVIIKWHKKRSDPVSTYSLKS